MNGLPHHRPRFPTGKTVIAPATQATLEKAGVSPVALLDRHRRGDWGKLEVEDIAGNALALLTGHRLLSSYVIPDGGTVWVITEADRSITTILLPGDY